MKFEKFKNSNLTNKIIRRRYQSMMKKKYKKSNKEKNYYTMITLLHKIRIKFEEFKFENIDRYIYIDDYILKEFYGKNYNNLELLRVFKIVKTYEIINTNHEYALKYLKIIEDCFSYYKIIDNEFKNNGINKTNIHNIGKYSFISNILYNYDYDISNFLSNLKKHVNALYLKENLKEKNNSKKINKI